MVAAVTRRRSPRLAVLKASSSTGDHEKPKPAKVTKASTKKQKNAQPQNKLKNTAPTVSSGTSTPNSTLILPRTRENSLKNNRPELTWVMGIDEAGRGPLAGPVVAAAVVLPNQIDGITDSKKITSEKLREELYEQIINSPGVTWAVAVVDAARIDEINILQATMQAMSMAASALVMDNQTGGTQWDQVAKQSVCATRKGSYVACGGEKLHPPTTNNPTYGTLVDSDESTSTTTPFYALVDGNRVPKDLPCESESIVKGDSKEYSIAAASILAKVSRDRLMHAYHKLYPEYNLSQHKGYPTKDHMAAVFKFGASPIHRRTFAPLKHMEFDENGKVVDRST